MLNWSLATEENNKEFVVERSTDAIHWIKLFTVASRGNSALQTNYNGMDPEPVTGTNFYRIKQVDIDGRFTYSSITSVKFAKDRAEYMVYPNPAHDVIEYKFLNGGNGVSRNLELSGVDGKLLKQFYVNSARGSFSVRDLPAGIYVLTIKDNTGIIEKKKIIVQR